MKFKILLRFYLDIFQSDDWEWTHSEKENWENLIQLEDLDFLGNMIDTVESVPHNLMEKWVAQVSVKWLQNK